MPNWLIVTVIVIVVALVWIKIEIALNRATKEPPSTAPLPPLEPNICICPQGIVTWVLHVPELSRTDQQLIGLANTVWKDDMAKETNAKIRKILAANPKADLSAFETALHMKIINIQLTKKDEPPKPPDKNIYV